MSDISDYSISDWKKCTTKYNKTLPKLTFPFEKIPEIYHAADTQLHLNHKSNYAIFQWCYLQRVPQPGGTKINRQSLSKKRISALPFALTQFSNYAKFKNLRPRTIYRILSNVSGLLLWCDQPHHSNYYESIFTDANVALDALNGYHTFLQNLVRTNQIRLSTGSDRDHDCICYFSQIHNRAFSDEIEALQSIESTGTSSPDSDDVGNFSSTLQAIFDSASEVALRSTSLPSPITLKLSATDDSNVCSLKNVYGRLKLLDLACISFAGLAFADSGANFSVLAEYEEPENLLQQLAEPNRINLVKKAIKFRAGGKEVEVHFSSTIITRIKTYLRIRQTLIASINVNDIPPLFIQCTYSNTRGEPTGISSLDKNFLALLRRRISRIGAFLPEITLRQLRAYKQQKIASESNVAIAAKIMGTTVRTAISSYCNSEKAQHRHQLSDYFNSLKNIIVMHPSKEKVSGTITPIGKCLDDGNPSLKDNSAPVIPDCKKFEGCFFCDKYRIHADAEDIGKLMSCRKLLKLIMPISGDALRAQEIYNSIISRINHLLGELHKKKPKDYQLAYNSVEQNGNLTRYWANKLQQLHLLGVISNHN